MPNRVLRESITTSNSIDLLSTGAECCFYRLLTVVDDYGRQDARPSVLRAKCYPLKLDSVSDVDVAAYLEELISAGMVVAYVGERGGVYLQLVNWERYRAQSRRAGKSKFPEPPTDRTAHPRKSSEILGNPPVSRESLIVSRESTHDRAEGISAETGPAGAPSGVCVREGPFGDILDDELGERYEDGPSPRPFVLPPQVPKTAREAHFAAFRERYLASQDGTEWNWGEARKAWLEAVPPGEEEACLAKLALYAATDQVRRGYVKAPATWLPGWRGQQKPAPPMVRPGDKDAEGKLRLAV